MTIIGIDLGNYYTKIYKLSNGKPEIILTKESSRLFPTIINFTYENDVIISRILDETSYKYTKDYKNKLYNIPEFLTNKEQFYPYNYWTNNSIIKSYLNVKFTFTHIIVILINYIKSIIKTENIEIVMTFSNNINYKTIKLIHNAFEILNIKLLGLISCTIANSIDYGFPLIVKKKIINSSKKVIFIDFGYINAKISIINYQNNEIKEMYTNDQIKVGSYFIDCKLLDYLISDFWLKNNIDLNKHPKQKIQLFYLCEKIRKDFSMNKDSRNTIHFYIENKEYDYLIYLTLDQYQIFYNETENILIKQFKNLNDNYGNLDEIIITGGFYRSSILKKIVSKIFSLPIKTVLDLEESSSKGSTILGALFSQNLKNTISIPLKLKLNHPIFIRYDNKTLIVAKENDYYPLNKQITIKNIKNLLFTASYDNSEYFQLDKFLVPNINKLPNLTTSDNNSLKKIIFIKVKLYLGYDKLIKITEYKIKYSHNTHHSFYQVYPVKNNSLDKELLDIKTIENKSLKSKQLKIKLDFLKNEIETEFYKIKNILSDKNNMVSNKEYYKILEDKYNNLKNNIENIYNINDINILNKIHLSLINQ